MNGLFAKHLSIKDGVIVKSYSLLDIISLENYIKTLTSNKINVAKILNIEIKDQTTIIHQQFVDGETLSQFIVKDALNNKRISSSGFNKFKKFIKMYFSKIYPLDKFSVDCKLSNFIATDFTLVDIVPILHNSEYNRKKPNINYVCYNRDLQIKNIITYWLKSYILFSYQKNRNPLRALNQDFKKMYKFVSKHYTFTPVDKQNKIEQGFSKRFEMLKTKQHENFDTFKRDFLNNNFFSILNQAPSSKPIGKIYLLGGSGTGKSFTTEKIKSNSSANVLDLDNIYWKENNYSTPQDEHVRNSQLYSFLTHNDNLIVEGSYVSDWVLPCFDICDKVYVISSNYKLQKRRIISRFIKRKLKIEPNTRKENLKSIKGLLSWSQTYEQKLKNFIDKHYDKYKDKIVIVESAEDVLSYVFSL